MHRVIMMHDPSIPRVFSLVPFVKSFHTEVLGNDTAAHESGCVVAGAHVIISGRVPPHAEGDDDHLARHGKKKTQKEC